MVRSPYGVTTTVVLKGVLFSGILILYTTETAVVALLVCIGDIEGCKLLRGLNITYLIYFSLVSLFVLLDNGCSVSVLVLLEELGL